MINAFCCQTKTWNKGFPNNTIPAFFECHVVKLLPSLQTFRFSAFQILITWVVGLRAPRVERIFISQHFLGFVWSLCRILRIWDFPTIPWWRGSNTPILCWTTKARILFHLLCLCERQLLGSLWNLSGMHLGGEFFLTKMNGDFRIFWCEKNRGVWGCLRCIWMFIYLEVEMRKPSNNSGY